MYATTSFDTIINHAKNYNTKSVTSSAPSNTSVAKKNVFQFYRPYSKNQQNGEIKILQEFLKSESLYKGDIDGVYSSAVIDAVYDFQLKYGLLTASSPFNLRGYFGPGTRRKVNQR